jgi:hypothetical protein
VACLLALSAWPAAISGHSFAKTAANTSGFTAYPAAQAVPVGCVEIPGQPGINKCMTLPAQRSATEGVMTP